MRLTLSSEGVRNTIMTNEEGQVLYKTSTPFRFGTRTTTLYKVIPNIDPDDMQDHMEAIGEIEWNLIRPSIMRLHGQEMMTNTFIPRHGFRGRKRTFTGPDGLPYRWDMDFKIVRLSRNDATRQELARSYRRSLGIIGPRRDPSLDVDPKKLRMDKEEQAKRSG
ncbi:hypothetical protein EDC04DRAFT_2760228 [Pisolithus marmoratus]|nr:hypothetical protein EDC04DRAFT_2760228 [Pisolithus marmoratus]